MRTVGSLGKAKFLQVTIRDMKEVMGLTDDGKIFVSAEDYAKHFGINLNTAPRTKIIRVGTGAALPAVECHSIAEASVSLKHEEKAAPAPRVNFSDYE